MVTDASIAQPRVGTVRLFERHAACSKAEPAAALATMPHGSDETRVARWPRSPHRGGVRVSRSRLAVLPRSFYRRDSREVAPELLNKILLGPDGRSARIVETEAYCGAFDEAAHTFRGKTARNATMFGPPGHLYVYFTYGMHWCANTSCGEEGEGIGVLLRAAEPLSGLQRMHELRLRAKNDRELCSGPARLCQAFGITRVDDGTDLLGGRFRIASDGMPPPSAPAIGKRVGITRAIDAPWRFHVPGNPFVSKPWIR
jgi:DNA-3-methyladenine glycosylase